MEGGVVGQWEDGGEGGGSQMGLGLVWLGGRAGEKDGEMEQRSRETGKKKREGERGREREKEGRKREGGRGEKMREREKYG